MATEPGTRETISIETRTVFSLPYFVARDEGYFEDEGLRVSFVPRD
jgi:ABC-type nitrate/sulfonate/bicarbonate transport system substrate-binding protein